MKTHDLAKALTALSKVLRSLPNQELESFSKEIENFNSSKVGDVGISLSTLAAFSKYGKNDWQNVIYDFDLPIEIRPRDAARDVMGKILSYLAENDAERERVARKNSQMSKGSSELSNALSFLLSNG